MIEVLIVVAVLFLLFMMIDFGPDRNGRRKAERIACVNNLKQIGLALHDWNGDRGGLNPMSMSVTNEDHTGLYPMSVSVTNGGAMESVLGGNPVPVFQVMSNEFGSPKFLVCPADETCTYATNFMLTRKNVSYFINPDAIDGSPQDILSGDDNFEFNHVAAHSGLWGVSSNTPIGWSADRHKFAGNLLVADGSVLVFNNPSLTNWLASTNFTPMRVAIP